VTRSEGGTRRRSDEQLLARFLEGDEASFSELVRRYSSELYRFVGRFVHTEAVAEDVVQDTFIQLHQSAAGFDLSRRLRPWLFTIAANKARDHLRSRGRRREVSLQGGATQHQSEEPGYIDFLADETLSPTDAIEDKERAEIVRAIIAEMPDRLREILILGYYEQFPYKEIAEILSIPLGTVKSRLHAAVAHFAKAYKLAATRHSEKP